MERKNKTIEKGDFQTPASLADEVCRVLGREVLRPQALVEPTCGTGNFIFSGLDHFSSIREAYGFDVSRSYVKSVQAKFDGKYKNSNLKKGTFEVMDFFKMDWEDFFNKINKPILVIGNPPWVTNAKIGVIGGKNLPPKTNFQKLNGFDALMGKSNFDISEWMLIKLVAALQGKDATLAMLCKTAVARKVLHHGWKNDVKISGAKIYEIDAKANFGVSVDACLFVCDFSALAVSTKDCEVYGSMNDIKPKSILGYEDGRIIADVPLYRKWKEILSGTNNQKWRSGVKHDCSKVMELTRVGQDTYENGFGDNFQLESDLIYPLLKSSDLFNEREPKRWVIITQKKVGEDTSFIKHDHPKLWKYLNRYDELLNNRVSTIYENKPKFSIFGIGEYTFAPWKIAISGFYKEPKFRLISSYEKKPVMFDDTINFLSFQTKKEAEEMLHLLQSQAVTEALQSMIFLDSKRPVTVELLKTINLSELAELV